MNRIRRCLLALLAILFASGALSGALAASSDSILTLYDTQTRLEPGALARLTLPGDSDSLAEYVFTPTANGDYGVYLFPVSVELTAHVELWQGEEKLAEGDGSLQVITHRLISGVEYTLKLSGYGSAMLEVARESLSRCFAQPLSLEDGASYSKPIAKAGDVHWYSVTAQSAGAAILACAPKSPSLKLRAWLFGSDGRMIANAEMLASGTAVLSALFEQDQTYFIRVSAADRSPGKYQLTLLRDECAERAEAVTLSETSIEIDGRATHPLDIALEPEGACPLVYLDSSDPACAVAGNSGYVEGRKDGAASIVAYAFGGARSSCRVRVNYVPVESVAFDQDDLRLSMGSDAALNVTLTPYNATDRGLTFSVSDESHATIDDNGVLHALAEGRVEVTVTSQDGACMDTLTVIIGPAQRQYRALLIGEQNYAATVEAPRQGSVKSVESVMSLLKSMSFGGSGCAVSMVMDASRDNVVKSIRKTFESATEADVSILYITCHGFYRAGMTFFLMADGSVLSAAELEKELRQIPGQIVILADCCGSGGLIGQARETTQILDGITAVFEGVAGEASVKGSKYLVIASALLDQDSHRISFDGDENMATVFARALCDGLGWNMDRAAPGPLNADTDYDGEITLDELFVYLKRRVNWYLSLAGSYDQSLTAGRASCREDSLTIVKF